MQNSLLVVFFSYLSWGFQLIQGDVCLDVTEDTPIIDRMDCSSPYMKITVVIYECVDVNLTFCVIHYQGSITHMMFMLSSYLPLV